MINSILIKLNHFQRFQLFLNKSIVIVCQIFIQNSKKIALVLFKQHAGFGPPLGQRGGRIAAQLLCMSLSVFVFREAAFIPSNGGGVLDDIQTSLHGHRSPYSHRPPPVSYFVFPPDGLMEPTIGTGGQLLISYSRPYQHPTNTYPPLASANQFLFWISYYLGRLCNPIIPFLCKLLLRQYRWYHRCSCVGIHN